MPTKAKDTLPARPRSIVRVAFAVGIAIVVMLGATTWITVRVDRQMEAREAALVRALLSERLRDLSRAARAIAAGLAEDPAAAAAIPASWAGAAGDPEIERVYVVAADGRIDSARIHGVAVENERPADLGAAIDTLAGRLRSPVASARPAADAGLVAAANGPLLLAAAAAAGVHAPTVVVVSPLMKGRLAEAALVQSLAGLRFRTDGPIGEAETALPVTDLWGHKAGAFAWTSAAPGRAILWTIFPVSLAVLVGLGAMASAAVHHVGRSTQRLAESESRALKLALCDPLTGVSNRLQFFEALSGSIRNARAGQRYALLLIDLDRFKDVNDTFGHHVGDALLSTVSQRLREMCGEEAIVARIGGDEFALLLSGPVSETRALKAAQEMVRALRRPVRASGHTLEVGCSIGIAIAPDHGSERNELMRRADIALYAAKAEGRGRVAVFAPEIEKEYRYRRFVERELRAAILTDEITLDYQPIYGADGSEMIGVEALVRWRHSFRGVIPPSEFIAIAEETGLIFDLGRRVLDLACQAGVLWPDLFVAVNLSPVQVRRPDIIATVRDALAHSGLSPSRLVLEVTEGIFLADDADTMATLGQLRRLGVKIALDDFGTGYSSLGYLRRFQFDKLKIDQSFLQGLGQSADTAVILHAIVNLGRGLGLVVTAEGVETDEHFRFLRAAGCHELQGYHFARPMPASAVSRLIGSGVAAKAVALA